VGLRRAPARRSFFKSLLCLKVALRVQGTHRHAAASPQSILEFADERRRDLRKLDLADEWPDVKLDVLPVAVDRAALQAAPRARFNPQIRRLGNRDAGAVRRVSPLGYFKPRPGFKGVGFLFEAESLSSGAFQPDRHNRQSKPAGLRRPLFSICAF
jgi:hypothetical protein